MDDIFVYYTKMPRGQHEWVTPCDTGYTVYLDECCLYDELLRRKCFFHAIRHIANQDFENGDVSNIEFRCHG